MLDELRDTIQFVLNLKNKASKTEVQRVIVMAGCHHITDKYILLIPNEKNYRDSAVLQNLDSTKVIKECDGIKVEYSLFELMMMNDDADKIIKFLVDTTIIVKSETNLIEEFTKIMKVYDELSDKSGTRHLTRRILSDSKWDNVKIVFDNVIPDIENYFNDNEYFFNVGDIDSRKNGNIKLEIHLQTKPYLDDNISLEGFFQSHLLSIKEQLGFVPFFKGGSINFHEVTIYLPSQIGREHFNLNITEGVEKQIINSNKRFKYLFSDKYTNLSQIVVDVDVHIPYTTFMESLIKYL